MNADEYKYLKQQENIVNFPTLDATRKLLAKDGKLELAQDTAAILAGNEIGKPSLHNTQTKYASSYYVTLSNEEIEVIISMLCDKEVAALDNNWQTTPAASFYASMLDTWNALLQQRSGRNASAGSA